MNEEELIKTKWKDHFSVNCKACGHEASINIHLNSDDTDHYYGEIYFKCNNCKSDRVYAAKAEDEIFSFNDIGFKLDIDTSVSDLLADLPPLVDEYEQWNANEREDGMIIHTDAIADFLEWLGRKAPQ